MMPGIETVRRPTAAPAIAAAPRRRSLWRSPVSWLLVAVFAIEFFCFDQFGAHRFTPVYPRWHDQIQYLSESYRGHVEAQAHGLAAGLKLALTNPAMQGTLHDVVATFVFAIVGPSRSAALALNLIALLLWQCALFVGVHRVTRSTAFAFAAAMLPLALAGPWQDIPGSAYDFRLDHLALCGIGTTSALALLTDGFRGRWRSILFGAAIGVTMVTRFLTGTYFVVLFLVLLAWTLRGDERRLRAGNLLWSAAVALAVAAPILWLNRQWVWEYYYIGHYIGPESAIRNQHYGLGRSITFLATELTRRHLGAFFLVLSGAAAGALYMVRERAGSVSGRDENREALGQGRATPSRSATTDGAGAMWFFGAAYLFAPALIQTLHQQKSEVVVSALVPGVVLLVIALWRSAAGGLDSRRVRYWALAAGLIAFASFVRLQFSGGPSSVLLAENRKIAALVDYLHGRIAAAHLERPALSVDHITDAIDAQVIRVVMYERKKQWLDFEMPLPTGIAVPDEADVMRRLQRSDFVFLTETGSGGFPFDMTLDKLRPQLRAWCDEHLQPVQRFTLFGRGMILYQSRKIPFPAPRP